MKIRSSVLTALLTAAALIPAIAAQADTVTARCDVYPKGNDRASWTGPCTFAQRQGVVGIELQNGKRYDLRPTGNEPGNYLDQNNQAAYRQAGLGDRGQIYRLAQESIYVYWNPAPDNQPNNPSSSGKPPVTAQRGISTLRASSSNTRINVRSQPTINSSAPQYGLPGDQVQVLNCVVDQDTPGSTLNWCNVRFVKSKAVGWVRSDFIIFADGGE